MELNLGSSLSVDELSAEIGVSVRTLNVAFGHYYGVSPTQYHRLLRLKGARHQLRQSSPADTTVTDVATRWGFWHFGRFSQVYRSQFGELPSETLLRRTPLFKGHRIVAHPTG